MWCEIEELRMRPIALFVAAIMLGAVALTLAPASALAHSLAELQAMLRDQEKHFESIDKGAPQFMLRDVDGRVVRLADFRGKVVVLNFMGANCPDVCQRQTERIAEVQSMINQSPMKYQVQFVTIGTSLSRDGDSDDVLAEHGRVDGIDPVNWVFLTADPDHPESTMRELAEQFGHNVEKTKRGDQVKGVVIHIVDKEGQWRANFRGLRFEPINVVVFVNALVNDITKLHHDPDRGFWQKLKRWF